MLNGERLAIVEWPLGAATVTRHRVKKLTWCWNGSQIISSVLFDYHSHSCRFHHNINNIMIWCNKFLLGNLCLFCSLLWRDVPRTRLPLHLSLHRSTRRRKPSGGNALVHFRDQHQGKHTGLLVAHTLFQMRFTCIVGSLLCADMSEGLTDLKWGLFSWMSLPFNIDVNGLVGLWENFMRQATDEAKEAK